MKYGLVIDTCVRAEEIMWMNARRFGSPLNAGPDGMICIAEACSPSRSGATSAAGGVRTAGVRISLHA